MAEVLYQINESLMNDLQLALRDACERLDNNGVNQIFYCLRQLRDMTIPKQEPEDG